MKMLVAAVQMPAELWEIAANLERADALLGEASRAGAKLAVLPEMFNTGYGLLPDFGTGAEGTDGPTLRHLSGRSRQWRMGIAAGFVERAARHLYDALALCLPDGSIHIYRKRHLVFWERYRFHPGRSPLIVATPWGRIGLAICADMIYRNVWDGYRGQIDLGVIASAWPEFACRHSGRAHWLFGRLGPLSAEIPVKVARDLGIPVMCVNQCGPTRTTIPVLGLRFCQQIDDRFAGRSSICDGQRAPPVIAGLKVSSSSPKSPSTIPEGYAHAILCPRRSPRHSFPVRNDLDRRDGVADLLVDQPPEPRGAHPTVFAPLFRLKNVVYIKRHTNDYEYLYMVSSDGVMNGCFPRNRSFPWPKTNLNTKVPSIHRQVSRLTEPSCRSPSTPLIPPLTRRSSTLRT